MAPGCVFTATGTLVGSDFSLPGQVSAARPISLTKCASTKYPLEQREGLDLSCWNLAFCGAEPIRLETLDSFVETFAPYGFRRESFYPCYGLAESTLMVSGGEGPSGPLVNHFYAPALSPKPGQAGSS